jgi:hypothetical protein
MKPAINLLLVILLFFTSCVFFDSSELSNEQKQFLLYDAGGKFYFLKNKKDTVEFEVEGIEDIDSNSGADKILTFKRVSLTNSDTWGTIRVKRNNDYTLYFSGSNFTGNLKNMTPYIEDTIINSRQYKNVYFMDNQNNDTLFFSLEKGIIQIKNPRSATSYDLIE